MTPRTATTSLERQILAQPDELDRLIGSGQVRERIYEAAQGLHRARRIWLVGTGTSQHAGAIAASMIQEAGRAAHAVSSMQFVGWAPIVGPQDAIIVITHTAETAYALAARALAFEAGLEVVMVTREGAGFPNTIETVPKETSETYTLSYTTALFALAMLAKEMGAETITEDKLALIPGAVRNAIEASGTETIGLPARMLTLVGEGPTAITAREGALKIREAARMLAEGFDAEFLLHGSAVPLTAEDRLVAVTPPDRDGLVEALLRAAEGEGIPVSRVREPAPLPLHLAQIPLTVRLQVLALRFALTRNQDPDTVITGRWADEGLWRIGRPNA
jgi:glutamine---fructose-6-phosphate transaminase (isomerizing)